MHRRPVWLAPLLALTACAALQPRFTQNVEASFAHQPMRKLTTPSLELYYPEHRRETALRIAARLESCVEKLRQLPVTQKPRDRAVIVLTDSVFNNAYVQPLSLGIPQQMVLPDHMTLELFNWFELGVSEIEDISCHESVHYIQMQQTDGLFGALNLVTGGIWQPNVFTESWFLEGLATYYEGRLDKEVGRPHSMFWRGLFDSGVAARGGRLDPGFLDSEHRDTLPFGGNYLVGQRFVEYLARTYGDGKLWEFVDLQGHSIASPLSVTLRFRSIYGKTIGSAFDDFTAELAKTPLRERPPQEQVLYDDVGYLARMAGSPADGALAIVAVKRDEPTRLTVYESTGAVRFTRRLTLILPPRPWIDADPSEVSGMVFSRDGRWLYVMSADTSSDGGFESRLWRVDAHTGDVGRTWSGLDGFGGSLSPDGKAYVYVGFAGDSANLVRLDLDTKAQARLTSFVGRESLGAPSWGPDGRIAFSRWMGEGWDLWTVSPEGVLARVTRGGAFNYGAQWLDAEHLLALGAHDGRWQVQRISVSSGESAWLSDAPYIALDPVARGDRVVFLNRTAWSWSVDSVPLPADPPASLPPETPPANAEQLIPPIVADEAYSPFDHLLVPSLRLPIAYIFPTQSATNPSALDWGNVFAAASLYGSDRLDLHSYAVNLTYYSPTHQLGVAAGYGNNLAAPWFTQLSVARVADDSVRDLEAFLSTSRTFWTTPVSIGVQALDRTTYLFGGGPERERFVGPSASASYFAAEATAYGGTQRGLGVSVAAAYYPAALGGTFDMADLRGEVDGFIPLPLLKRHSLLVTLAGRALPGAPAGLLRVGGVPDGTLLGTWHFQGNASDGSPINLPQDLAFSEAVRGYEDYALRGTEAAIGGLRYRIPLVLDVGTTTVAYVLPSFFLRQIDFEAFGSAIAIDSTQGRYHRAAGAALLVRTLLGQTQPITLYAQWAYRFDDGLDPLFLTGIALE
jgi:hypothetical protein